jgi:uncharacterized RDD family membrane protein YckC
MTMARGWYSDPFSSAYLRWWDGERWTASTVVAGQGPPPAPPGSPAPPPAAPTVTPTAPTAAPPPYGQPPAYGQPSPYAQQPPWGPYSAPPWPPQVATFPLASWGSRFAARLIDWLILAVVLLPVGIALLWSPFRDFINSLPTDGRGPSQQVITDFYAQIFGRVMALTVLSLVLQFVYEVPQLVAYGRTPGKRLMGLRIRPLAEDRLPSWREATIRWGVVALGSIVGGGLFTLLDDLFPLWDKPWQQTLHDKAAKTVVVPL